MELLIFILIIFVFMVIYASVQQNKNKNVEKEHFNLLLAQETEEFLIDIERNQSLPNVTTNIILKAKENAFYSSFTSLYETRAVRHYESGHAGFRIAKGIYVGGTKGHSMSNEEWQDIDTGQLIITNERLIFNGKKTNRTALLNKIISVDFDVDNVEISSENRKKNMIFSASNPLILATIIRICCQVDNPNDFSNEELKIN